MKQKDGRDWLELSESIFTVDGDKFRISDSGASIYLTEEDVKRIVKFAATHSIKEQRSGAAAFAPPGYFKTVQPKKESVTIDRACFDRGCACFDPRIDKDFVLVEKRS